MSQMSISRIAAAILQRPDGKILLLKRSMRHTTNPGKWCFATGYVESSEEPRQTAIREVYEELGVHATPTRAGEIVVVQTSWGKTLHVYPFLFPVEDIEINLDWEHTDHAWIEPQELYQYDFVQQLDEDLIALGLL